MLGTIVLSLFLFSTCVVGMGLTLYASNTAKMGKLELTLSLLIMAMYSFLLATGLINLFDMVFT